jgi:hypothetical protein
MIFSYCEIPHSLNGMSKNITTTSTRHGSRPGVPAGIWSCDEPRALSESRNKGIGVFRNVGEKKF